MSDAPEEKTLAEIELEDTLRSIRGFRENADATEPREATASTVEQTDVDE
jgi:hypothetical protein